MIPTNHVTIQGYNPVNELDDDPNQHTSEKRNDLTTTDCFNNREHQSENKNIVVNNDTGKVIIERDNEDKTLRDPASFWIPFEETDDIKNNNQESKDINKENKETVFKNHVGSSSRHLSVLHPKQCDSKSLETPEVIDKITDIKKKETFDQQASIYSSTHQVTKQSLRKRQRKD